MSEWSQVPKRKKPQRKNAQSNVAAQQNAVVGGYFVDSAPKSKAAQKNANRAARRREAALARERQQRLLGQSGDGMPSQSAPTSYRNSETGSTGGGLREEWDGLEEALRLSKMEVSNTSKPAPPAPVEPVVVVPPVTTPPHRPLESVGDMPPAPAVEPAPQDQWVTVPRKETPRVTSSAPPPITNGPVMTKAAKKNAKRKAKREQERLRRQEADQRHVPAGEGFSSAPVEPPISPSQPSYQAQEPEVVTSKPHWVSYTQDTSSSPPLPVQSQISENSTHSLEVEPVVEPVRYSVPSANASGDPIVQSSPPHQAAVIAPVHQAPWGLDPPTAGVSPVVPAYGPTATPEPVPEVSIDARNGNDNGYSDEAPLPVPSFLDESAQEEQQRLLEDLQRKRAAMEAELARQQEILELKRATLELQEQQKRVQEQLDQLSQTPKTSAYNQSSAQTLYQQPASDSVPPPGMYTPFGVPQAKRHPDAGIVPPGIGGQNSYTNNNAENEPNGNGSVGTWTTQPRSFGRGGGHPRVAQDQQGVLGGNQGGYPVGGLGRVNKTLSGWQEAEQDTSMSDHAGISGSNAYVPPFRR